jgi:hypothetical protein
MSDYTTSYAIRYSTPPLIQKIEVAVVTAATQVQNEDSTTLDHADRLAWANWAVSNSVQASSAFGWPVAKNPGIIGSVESDPTGKSVLDSDVQFVVNSYLETAIQQWLAKLPA